MERCIFGRQTCKNVESTQPYDHPPTPSKNGENDCRIQRERARNNLADRILRMSWFVYFSTRSAGSHLDDLRYYTCCYFAFRGGQCVTRRRVKGLDPWRRSDRTDFMSQSTHFFRWFPKNATFLGYGHGTSDCWSTSHQVQTSYFSCVDRDSGEGQDERRW